MNIPKTTWEPNRSRWRMVCQRDGKRKVFYSTLPRKREGTADCQRQFLEWVAREEDPGTVLVEEAWAKFMADYKKRHKVSSSRKLDERGNTYILKRYGKHRLGKISRRQWQGLIDDKKHLSRKTLEGIATTIKTFLNFCAAMGYIDDADVPQRFIIPPNASEGVKRALHPAELQTLLAPSTDAESWYIPHFRFLVLTGIRRGELCALQTLRDFRSPYLTIRETISNELVTDSPKSGKSRTEILTDQALGAIRDHQSRVSEQGFVTHWLFCSSTGRQTSPKVLSEAWRKYRVAHDLGNITLHELRHTYATYADKSLDLAELKQMLGHSARMDTKATYVHEVELTPAEIKAKREADQARANKVSEVFRLVEGLGRTVTVGRLANPEDEDSCELDEVFKSF